MPIEISIYVCTSGVRFPYTFKNSKYLIVYMQLRNNIIMEVCSDEYFDYFTQPDQIQARSSFVVKLYCMIQPLAR